MSVAHPLKNDLLRPTLAAWRPCQSVLQEKGSRRFQCLRQNEELTKNQRTYSKNYLKKQSYQIATTPLISRKKISLQFLELILFSCKHQRSFVVSSFLLQEKKFVTKNLHATANELLGAHASNHWIIGYINRIYLFALNSKLEGKIRCNFPAKN